MARTVLIVEDNELNMKLFHDLLDAHGYKTLQTRSGMEALKIAREQRPDLILMDIQLPEVSGLEVTKWLKDDEELREIPVIAGHRLCHEGRRAAHQAGGAARPTFPSRSRSARFSRQCAGTLGKHESRRARRVVKVPDDWPRIGR
jgi:two-component system cell cycle response regulator DivK